MTENKVALKNMTEEELKEFLKSIGEKPFRGTQIFSWIYKGAKTFDDMNNIPKSLREKLEKVSYIGNIKQELALESKVDKCKNDAEVGAHVYKTINSKIVYIVPICNEHNNYKETEEMSVDKDYLVEIKD